MENNEIHLTKNSPDYLAFYFVAQAAAKHDAIRPNFEGIYVDGVYAIATDGYCMHLAHVTHTPEDFYTVKKCNKSEIILTSSLGPVSPPSWDKVRQRASEGHFLGTFLTIDKAYAEAIVTSSLQWERKITFNPDYLVRLKDLHFDAQTDGKSLYLREIGTTHEAIIGAREIK